MNGKLTLPPTSVFYDQAMARSAEIKASIKPPPSWLARNRRTLWVAVAAALVAGVLVVLWLGGQHGLP